MQILIRLEHADMYKNHEAFARLEALAEAIVPRESGRAKSRKDVEEMAAVAPATPTPPTEAKSTPALTAAVPTAAPTYTLDQISKAGVSLIDAGKHDKLLELLKKYGVQAVTALKPESYGAFATELRALGAQI